jgi:hypothetical protein
MGVASMVIGIVAAVMGFLPFCGYFAFLPAIVGLVLGIVDVRQRTAENLPKSQGVAGIVLNGIAILVILSWTILFATAGEFSTTSSIVK